MEIKRNEGDTVIDQKEIANEINNFFINKAKYNRYNVEEALKNVEVIDKTIFLNPVDGQEIKQVINKMPENKSPGDDGITMGKIK